ncbi:MAG: 1-acyl-sn-glycerol-3-phosphate acyltransferase [Chitinophagaceae bacterium]|nr:1-acyl-sn-glycerol-3-phosphate acyltransferase [Chitinophagaceae bacterium]MCB9046195.1 1-acyl-sn-glycerol-3-phosphate acyltransferase [Chitinophagales bacterium]
MKFLAKIAGHIYFVLGLLLFVITMLIVFIPIWLISLLPEPQRAKALHPVFRLWMGVFMPLVGCPVSRKGKEHFKKGENYVVVTNHNSLVDIPVSSPWIPGPNKTLAKIEMSRIPIFGVIYKTGSILVDRKQENSRKKSFTDMQRMLDMGLHLCLYPEGTRNKTKEPIQRFYDGAFIAAIKAQKAIIPGVIFNTGRILPHDKTAWARPLRIRFHFLEPIPTAGLTMDDLPALKEKVHTIMTDHYLAHK